MLLSALQAPSGQYTQIWREEREREARPSIYDLVRERGERGDGKERLNEPIIKCFDRKEG